MAGGGHVEQIKLIRAGCLLCRAVVQYAQGPFVGASCRYELPERIVRARQLEGRKAEVGVDEQSASQRLHGRSGVLARELGNAADEVGLGVQWVLCQHILGHLHREVELTTIGSLQSAAAPAVVDRRFARSTRRQRLFHSAWRGPQGLDREAHVHAMSADRLRWIEQLVR
jgi:hypothetical protein